MKQFRSMAYPYVAWITILIILPMLLIIAYAFTVEGTAFFQGQFTLDNFARFFSDAVFLQVLIRSMRTAIITTIVCLLLGYPAAYAISRSGMSSTKLILIITLPTWINMLVRTYAWVGILQDNGLLNHLLGLLHIGPFQFMYTDFAVVLGMVYNFLPFMILEIQTSLAKMDPSYLEAASDLGADHVKAFFKVTLPLSIPGIISGITLVFLPAVSSFFIPKLLGGGQYVLIGNVIESQFLTSGNWSFGSALSLTMVIIIMISMYFTRKLDRNREDEG
ncbi:ABC transporter permease [Butyricicoccus sp.]|uniref:ABC transporter permease n=1 Tax=Butyricicoccus sp. TaxID=2049021 RepID=UPI003F1533C1